MKFLVDANVLSEATKSRPVEAVLHWLSENETESVVNPIVLGELKAGILALPAGRNRTRLMDWFLAGVDHVPVLVLDAGTAHIWAQLLTDLGRKGRMMPVKDSLIAATALQHGLTIVTRNTADYRYAGVKIVNPFAK